MGQKTVRSLYDEYVSGETQLHILPEHGLVGRVQVAQVDVFGANKRGRCFRLQEDRQELKDGSIRKRNLVASLGGKMLRGETNWSATERILREKIGATQTAVSLVGYEQSSRPSDNYPGLIAYYEDNYFTAFLDSGDFKPEGYIERQPDQTNYYTWVPL